MSGQRGARRSHARRKRTRARRLAPIIASVAAEVVGTWLRSGRIGGELVVRCRRGHVFTTMWIPGVSVKSLRLGWWRVQYCPAGRHWTVVTPVKEADLSDGDRHAARQMHDVRVP
jgi:hypothetical protein